MCFNILVVVTFTDRKLIDENTFSSSQTSTGLQQALVMLVVNQAVKVRVRTGE